MAGRVGLKTDELHNMHWNLKDDPFCLGYGGVGGWPMRGDKAGAAQEAQRTKTQIADGLQQGLVTIPLWHVISEENGSAWGLEEICKFLQANKLPVMVMADAVRAVQNTRKYVAGHGGTDPQSRLLLRSRRQRAPGRLQPAAATRPRKSPRLAEVESRSLSAGRRRGSTGLRLARPR